MVKIKGEDKMELSIEQRKEIEEFIKNISIDLKWIKDLANDMKRDKRLIGDGKTIHTLNGYISGFSNNAYLIERTINKFKDKINMGV